MEKSETIKEILSLLTFGDDSIDFDEKLLENFTQEELESILENIKHKRESINSDNVEWLWGLSS